MSLGLSPSARVSAALSVTLALALAGCGSAPAPKAATTSPTGNAALTRSGGSADVDKAYLRLTIPLEQRLQAFAKAGKKAHHVQIRVLAPTALSEATSAEHRLNAAATRLKVNLKAGSPLADAKTLGSSPVFAASRDLTAGLVAGPTFDKVYIQTAQLSYAQAVALNNALIRSGKDVKLRGLALALVRENQSQLGIVNRISRKVNPAPAAVTTP